MLQSLALETWNGWKTISQRDFAGEDVKDWAFLQLQKKRQQLGETPQQYMSRQCCSSAPGRNLTCPK